MAYFEYTGKKLYYKEIGSGQPLLLLHGDCASSNMFELLLPFYQGNFKVILLDFLGYGKSDRVESLPSDVWFSQALQTIALLEYLHVGKVNLLGTSGGAWTALNVALERPDLVEKVIADSFDGRTLAEDFSRNLIKERTFAKCDNFAMQFYEWCQGEDWKSVVDLNTKALLACFDELLPLFHKPLQTLKVPVLLTGSVEDTMCRKDFLNEYEEMKRIMKQAEIYVFSSGEHPAMLTNAEEFAKLAIAFFKIDTL